MQFGFGAPVNGPLSGPRDLARIVSEGEAIGYDYCTIGDHVVIPRDMERKYPYSDTGEFPGRGGRDQNEQLTCVAFVAAKTSKLRLVTSVTVVPHRPPVLTAKITFSNKLGRFIVQVFDKPGNWSFASISRMSLS